MPLRLNFNYKIRSLQNQLLNIFYWNQKLKVEFKLYEINYP